MNGPWFESYLPTLWLKRSLTICRDGIHQESLSGCPQPFVTSPEAGVSPVPAAFAVSFLFNHRCSRTHQS